MPLGGGPADKAGNSYERRWTVFALIDVLVGRAQSLRIEVPGDDGVGSEFRLMVSGVPEWHQAKRQRADGPWTVSALANDNVVQPWLGHLTHGERCVFVSTTGADQLRELTERVGSAQSWDEFEAEFLKAQDVRKRFDRLRRAWNDPLEPDVYTALRHLQVRAIGEVELAEWINDRLRSHTKGQEPGTVAAVLAQLADASVHQELTGADVWAHLATHGITPRDLSKDAAAIRRVADSTDSYLARLSPLYIGGRELPRPEASTALGHLVDGRRTILAGAAGAGKSVVTAQTVTLARDQGWPVLVLSADRLPAATTTDHLGVALGMSESPVAILAGVAAGRDALIVIDQLDAVSVVSGRHPEGLGLITDLLREARSHPGLRVLLACRQFDIDNDRGLRAVVHDDAARVVPVGNLSAEQVRAALTDAGLPLDLPGSLLLLLTVPLHLALYVDLALAGVGSVQSARTLTDLYNSYWTAKRTACRVARCGADEWLLVVERLVTRMNDRQQLTVPEAVVDDLDQQVKVMASEGVVSISQGRVAFFHETFFDYCFARQFLASGGTIRALLTGAEQDLFRRAQVRQILAYQHGADPAGYLTDLTWLVTAPEVRPHIKMLVISLLDTVTNPTDAEWQVLRPVAEDPQSPLHLRLWQALRRNPAWFPVLDAAGVWTAMLRSGGDAADRALWALTGCGADHPARVRQLLDEAPPERWRPRRRGFLRMTDVHRARELVDLLLVAVDEGDFDTFDTDFAYMFRKLARAQPEWAAQVLAAFVRRVVAADAAANPFHPDARLLFRSPDLTSELQAIAIGAPGAYVDLVLPQLLDLMEANARPDWSTTDLVNDALWSHHIYRVHGSLSDDVYSSMGLALGRLAEVDPSHAASVFAQLRAQPYEAAAFLLARGYAGNPAAFADDAAEWLSATPAALLLGYAGSSAWVSRQLVAAIVPHCSPDRLDQLVDALLYYAPRYERTYEGRHARGNTELCLLNGIDPTLRPDRVERRLAELRRKFGRDDVAPPEGITGGAVPPPIPEPRARRMTDRQWLSAMRHYGTSDARWRDGRMIGDAGTQAEVLAELTKEDPQRFARLLLTLPPDIPEPYVGAILRGLAGARLDGDILRAVCEHAHRLGGSDVNRWLVRLVESHAAGTVPDELVEVVASIAVHDPDPVARQPGEPWNGGSIEGAALNSTRGAAVLALGRLVAEEPDRLALVQPALCRLVTDPQLEVRAATAALLASMLYADPDLALALFHEAIDHEAIDHVPVEVLGSDYVENFLWHALRRGRYADVAPVLQRMLTDINDEARTVAIRQLAVASYHQPELDGEVDAILTGGDDTARATAVTVFADNITYAPRRDRSIAVVAAAFYDPVKAVRDAAERAFFGLDAERLTDYEPMLAAFAGSPALGDGAGSALHALDSSREPLPSIVLDICEAFVRENRDDIGDITTGAAGDVMYIVRLALRLHAQHADPELRRRCLDLIDELVLARAYDIESDLDTIER